MKGVAASINNAVDRLNHCIIANGRSIVHYVITEEDYSLVVDKMNVRGIV